MKKRLVGTLAIMGFFIPNIAKAHCPLCVAGAGTLAVGAAYLGVNVYVVGVLVGAFALALGLWTTRLVKKNYIPHQKPVITTLVFFSTIIPISPLIQHYVSFNVYWFGEYGSLFNRTYIINRFLIGCAIGALIMYVSPYLSKEISKLRENKLIPYQGITITFILLIVSSLIMQFVF
jgi:hypothetical protein